MIDDTKLNLVLFRDAIEHMSRVTRVLSMQRGHFMVCYILNINYLIKQRIIILLLLNNFNKYIKNNFKILYKYF